MTVFGAVGVQDVRWGYRDSAGYVSGTDSALAAGEASGMGKLYGVGQMGIQKAASRNVVIPGDNGIFGAIKIATADLSQGQLITRAKNPVFTTGSQGTKLVAFGTSEIALDGIPCPDYKQLVMVVNSPAIDSNGTKGWSIKLYFNIQSDPSDNDAQDGNANEYSHSLIASLSTLFPWGLAFSAATHGSTRALMTEPFFSLYPLNIHSFTKDGVITTVVLDETPAGESASFILGFNNGAAMTYSATPSAATEYKVVASTKTVTIGAVGTSGHKCVFPYFFVPTC